MTELDLSAVYSKRILGDRGENIEQTIAIYRQILEIQTPQTAPIQWANTMMNLAIAYAARVKGDRAENIERAIEVCQSALKIQTGQITPVQRAKIMSNLANAYTLRVRGARSENIERAIENYQQALQVLTRESMPLEWAQTMSNLGLAFAERIQGDWMENIEQAIITCERALNVLTLEGTPIEWARAKVNLGIAYQGCFQGDRLDNIERAIDAYEQALKVLKCQTMPFEWARAMTNLATAFRNRFQGNKVENAEHDTIELYKKVLQILTRQVAPIEWARATNNLANAYLYHTGGCRAENIECAIEAYQQALIVLTREDWPVEWAQTSHNLAIAYSKRGTGDPEENLRHAVELYQQALQIRTRQTMPFKWATTKMNLGIVYGDPNRVWGDRAENVEYAIEACQQALEVFRPESMPAYCRRAARNLGDLYWEKGDWRSAYDSYATAIHAAEVLYRSAFVPTSKRVEIDTNVTLYDSMMAACVNLDYVRDALVYAESGKARTFLDEMGHADFPAPPDAPPHLLARERELINQLRQVHSTLQDADFQERSRSIHLKNLLDELEHVWNTLVDECPAAQEYVSWRRAEPVAWDDLARLSTRLGPQVALIEFYTRKDKVIAFVLRDGWDVPQLYVLPIAENQLRNRYLESFREEVLEPPRRHRDPPHTWLKLGDELFPKLESALNGTELVYLVPHGRLHRLPLHALTVHGEPFIARYAVVYAPSLAVLARILDRTSGEIDTSQALVMGFTPNSDPEERDLFLGEAKAIAGHFGCEALLNAAADVNALRSRAPFASCIHLSCHGKFIGDDPLASDDSLASDDPLASSVQLSGGNFTARDWMRTPLHADLVTLSACESGQVDIGRGDEIQGLTRAILYGGVSSILLTLWQVRPESTRDWMLDFYRRAWDETTGKANSKAFAFQQATLALREKQPDPYYWAPFVLVGNWQ